MINHLLLTITDQGVATVTLNRPELHNAFDDQLIQALLTVFQDIDRNPAVRVLLLKALGKSFSAGADLHWMRRMASYSYADNKKDALALSELMYTLKFLSKPTIACVQGAAFGGGVGLVACCDMAIATMDASFCLSEVKIGLIPAVISPYVIAAIGERAARRYFMTAEVMTTNEALRLGLISQLIESPLLDATIDEVIQKLLMNSPEAVQASKKLITRLTDHLYSAEQIEKNAEEIAALRVSKEGQEGISAFLEKRKPHWFITPTKK